MATHPNKYVTLQKGESTIVKSGLGETRELRLCVVPGRLAIDLLMAAGNEDPQTVVALAAGVPVEELDWVDPAELPRLQEMAIDLNFRTCEVIAETRNQGATRMLPVLRKMGKRAIDQAMETLLKEWETSIDSKLPSLRHTIEQALSSGKTRESSSTPSPSPESASASATPPSGPSSPASS